MSLNPFHAKEGGKAPMCNTVAVCGPLINEGAGI